MDGCDGVEVGVFGAAVVAVGAVVAVVAAGALEEAAVVGVPVGTGTP